MYFVYVLRSLKRGKLYYGQTKDINSRLKQHNSGKTKSTRSGIPYLLVFYEICTTREKARLREKYFKSGIGWEYIKRRLDSALVVQLDRISDFGSEG